MPQDGLRSSLYRSFVTCHDPKGVVTCKTTIRKSKPNSGFTSHKMAQVSRGNYQIGHRKMNSGFSESNDEEGEEEEKALHSPASFQLMEVSRGAQKLNRMIECWSRGQSSDIANDLLRGAIDLQDSLVMLGKLQEASRYMASLKRRHRRNHRRQPEDGRSSGEDLKRVIRESLVKNQPAVSSNAEEFSPPPCRSAAPKAAKSPNLIAKLMGLEECPSRPLPEKRWFGVDAPPPRTRSADPAAVAERRRRSLREILETMEFKGILRSDNSSEANRPSSDRSRGNAEIGEPSPIVLMKPLRVQEKSRSAVEEEDPLYRRKMLRKLRKTEELRPKSVIVGYRERASKSDKRIPKPEEEEKEIVAKARAASRPAKRSEGGEKRAEKAPAKSPEKDVVKSRVVPKREDEAKRVLAKARKVDSESKMAKNRNSSPPSAAKRTEQASAWGSTLQRKNSQRKEKPVANKPKSVIEEKNVELSGESDYHEVTIDTTTEAQLAIFEDQLFKEDAEIEQDRCDNGRNSPSEDATPSTTPSHNKRETDTNFHPNPDIKTFNTSTTLRSLLTSSLSFQTRAEELFDLNPTLSQPPLSSFGDSSATKLFLDCANELIERKSLLESQPADPLVPTRAPARPRQCATLAALAEEACEAIEALRSYGGGPEGEGGSPGDGLYAMLARDMASRGAANGVWDAGWRAGLAPDDAEEVVREVERMVLSGLIDEVLA